MDSEERLKAERRAYEILLFIMEVEDSKVRRHDMGMMKRILEDVAEEMGGKYINDPEVLAEAQRRLEAQEDDNSRKVQAG